jgi:hypothetical protein
VLTPTPVAVNQEEQEEQVNEVDELLVRP